MLHRMPSELPSPRMLLGAVNQALNRLTSVSDARADLQKLGWFPEESAASDRCYRNVQDFGDLVLGQKCLKWVARVCHAVLSRWLSCHRDSRIEHPALRESMWEKCGKCGNCRKIYFKCGLFFSTVRIFTSSALLLRASFRFQRCTGVLSCHDREAASAIILSVIRTPRCSPSFL
jgi:hypothetical protein